MIFFRIFSNIANVKKPLLCCLFLFTQIIYSFAITPVDTTDYYKENYLRYEDYTYQPGIKTPQLYKVGSEMSSPIIELNGSDKLHLSFDDIDAQSKNYYYTFIHCDASWKPTNMSISDYVDGYTEDKITEFQYSFNTLQKYIHYSLTFPGEIIKLTKSGNYIIKVFEDNDQNKLILTKRFMVVDPKIGIDATVKPSPNFVDRSNQQIINFTITNTTYPIDNPQGDIKVVLRQNNRWDNAITNLKPLFIKDNQLIYSYDEGNAFKGGNEFRMFDTRSLRFQTERILKFEFDSLKNNHVFLLSDENRQFRRYTSYSDINGNFKINVREGNNSDIEADYAFVHFSLPFDAPVIDGNLYLFGALTEWRTDKRYLLKYNYRKFAYETTIYLKQGYYNYQYVFVKDKENKIEDTFTEGNHSETENEYAIYVYHKGMGGRYDQLIGVKHLNSSQGY